MNLILASSSAYRAKCLEILRLPFVQISPEIEETEVAGESTTARCLRLASSKASAVMDSIDTPCLVIGSDQVASVGGRILHKPGNFENAFRQLELCRGNWIRFETAISLMGDGEFRSNRVESFEIKLREVTDTTITRYLNLESPFDCAGSLKVESLGITLIEDCRGRDWNTVVGLPLMLLTEMLSDAGIDLINQIR